MKLIIPSLRTVFINNGYPVVVCRAMWKLTFFHTELQDTEDGEIDMS